MSKNRVALSWRAAAVTAPAALGILAAAAAGDVVDLTSNMSGQANGGLFERASVRPAGSGVIDSFVRIHGGGVQQGYNSSGRPLAYNEMNGTHTRDLRLGDVGTMTVDGTSYYEFLLDINEPSSAGAALLSLDQLQVFTSSMGGQTTSNVSSLGTMVYDLDAGGDNWVKLNARLNPGSGTTDMRLLLPTAMFGEAGPDTFVYLFSLFGATHGAEGGFEEWGVMDGGGGPIVPTPTAALAGGASLLVLGVARIVRRRKQALI